MVLVLFEAEHLEVETIRHNIPKLRGLAQGK